MFMKGKGDQQNISKWNEINIPWTRDNDNDNHEDKDDDNYTGCVIVIIKLNKLLSSVCQFSIGRLLLSTFLMEFCGASRLTYFCVLQ